MFSPANEKEMMSARAIELYQTLCDRQQRHDRIRQAVAIVGPGDAPETICEDAYVVARTLASAGLVLLCGGRGGVMQAAARGASDVGGTVIGLLPEEDLRSANPYLTVAIPTGMGEMRNALIARGGVCLVSIGDNMGTISERALGLKWGKRVFTLHAELDLPGSESTPTRAQLIERVLAHLVCVT